MQHIRHMRPASLLLTFSLKNVPIRSQFCALGTRPLIRCTRTVKDCRIIFSHQTQPLQRQVRCGFHTTHRREVHPLIWVIIKPVAKISAALTGRGVRKWYRRMDPKERKEVWVAIRDKWYLFAGAFGTLVSFFAFYYWSHVEETPITGRKRFVALTHEQILSIAKAQAESIIEGYKDKMYPADSIQATRVMDVAARLLMANPELRKMSFEKWEVFVINDPLVNACVMPSGHVFVFDGMLKAAMTQDELAIILGHEMAHALLEHGIEELSYGQFIDYIVIVIMAALWCVIPNDGIALVTQWFHNKLVHILTHLPHSRALEEEADRVGAMLAAKACFDIRHGVVLWRKMDTAEKMTTDDSLPNFLSTHPHNLKRADFFDFIFPKAEQWRAEGKCPLLPKNDPRAAIQVISKLADEHISAKKTGQNLKRVHVGVPQVGKALVSSDMHVSHVADGKDEAQLLAEGDAEKDLTEKDIETHVQ